jgi:hypothetical protein
MIMEGTSIGTGHLQRHYDHENGAGLIAMESAEALRDIFEATFYTPNTCTIAAAMEGYSSVEESATHSAIMEAAVNSAFEKIRQFFINLKDKVKEFIHNIKRYLSGIFSNDEKWVKTYEKDLKAINSADLKDYKVKMYDYSQIIPALTKTQLAEKATSLTKDTDDAIKDIRTASLKRRNDAVDEDALNDKAKEDYLGFIKDLVGKSIDEDELAKALWSKMRGGADDEKDKEDLPVASNINMMIDTLKKSSSELSAYDTAISKTESMYTAAVKLVDNASNSLKVNDKTGNAGAVAQASAALRVFSSTLSKMQTAQNSAYQAAKSALSERNHAYKSALTGAFAYARKHKGGK